VTGYLQIKQLTTNVTGHFALFIYDLAHLDFWKGTVYFLYIFCFLLGSFVSSSIFELKKGSKNKFIIPTILESVLLIMVASTNIFSLFSSIEFIACSLLFAMGIQNSFVTKISNAVVRTTHLIGLFTDLGIDLSYLIFNKKNNLTEKVKENIKLRFAIITSFFGGGLIGGYLYSEINLKLSTLYLAALILLISLIYNALNEN